MGRNDLGQLTVKVGMDKAEFTRNMSQLQRDLKTSKAQFDLAGQGVGAFGNKVDKNAAQMQQLGVQMGIQKQKLAGYSKQYEQAGKNLEGTGQRTSKAMQTAELNMAKTRKEMMVLGKQYYQLDLDNRLAGNSMYQFADKVSVVSTKMQTVGKNVSQFGKKWTRMGIVVGGATGLIVKQFVDWESSVASMRKTINGSPQEIDDLATSFRGMSKEIPVSSSELNELAGVAGQLGIETGAIEGFTRTIADLGATTNISSQEAAVSLAQFANITRMSQGDFDRLGSTIVELGNNFAVQEDVIVQMSQRLAAAGHQIGLTEPEIVGISTALGSLGIKAEQGGSSFSKLMINMNLAVERGGDDLAQFADVAGMTSDQFKQSFEQDAVQAIAAFVQGLGNASEHGETAIGILDDMGIKEIRLRDTLLRAGNAQDLFTDAVETGSRAWDENTALTDEANLRYETSASKIQIAKNTIQDMAITLGGTLMPAIADLVSSAGPVVDMLSSWIEKFAESSDGTKKFVASLLGLTILGGPIVQLFGGIISATSTLTGGLADGVKAVIKFGTESKSAAAMAKFLDTGVVSLGTSAGATAEGVGLLGSSTTAVTGGLAALNPVVVGVGVALVAGVAAWQLWGKEALRAKQSTDKWGTDVGEAADKALTSFQDLGSEVQVATSTMSSDLEGGAERAKTAFSTMSDDIVGSATKTIEDAQSELSKFPPRVQEMLKESYDDQIAEQEKIIGRTQEINDKINQIYSNAVGENRELTENELKIIDNFHTELNDMRAKTLELSADDQRKVQEVMAKDLESFSKKQLKARQDALEDEIRATKSNYDEQMAILEDRNSRGLEIEGGYEDAKEALRTEELNRMIDHGAELVKVWEASGVPIEDQKKRLAGLGIDSEKVMRKVELDNQQAANSYELLAESSAGATDEVKEANETWNNMILDEKTGEVKTNLEEVIQKASESEEGWEQLQFIMKNADLSTNAKEKIRDALMANGKWWEMDFPGKFADLETNATTTAVDYLSAHGMWEGLSYEDKMAVLNTNSPETLQKALQDVGIWEQLNPGEQELLMSTTAGQALKEVLVANGSWESLTPSEKEMVMTTNAPETTLEGIKANGKWNGLKFEPKTGDTKTNASETANEGKKAERTWNGIVLPEKVGPTKTNASETANEGKTAEKTWNGIKLPYKDGPTGTNALETEGKLHSLTGSWSKVPKFSTKTFTTTLRTVKETISKAIRRKAAGSNFFEGGPAILGDGGNNEPYLTPGGDFGISPNKDTVMDLPRGTKIWRNIEALSRDLPKYANGTLNDPIKVGDETFNKLQNSLVPFSNRLPTNKSETASETSSDTHIEGDTYEIHVQSYGDLSKVTIDKLAKRVTKAIEREETMRKTAKGERIV